MEMQTEPELFRMHTWTLRSIAHPGSLLILYQNVLKIKNTSYPLISGSIIKKLKQTYVTNNLCDKKYCLVTTVRACVVIRDMAFEGFQFIPSNKDNLVACFRKAFSVNLV